MSTNPSPNRPASSRPARRPTSPIVALSVAALAAVAAPLTAQRMAVPGTNGTHLQLFDLREARDPRLDAGGQLEPESLRAAADLLRRFLEPALEPSHDLVPIGRHSLALLADEPRLQALQRLFDVAKQRRLDVVTIDVSVHRMPAATFVTHVLGRLTQRDGDLEQVFEAVLDESAVAGFSPVLALPEVETLTAPRVAVAPLHLASLHTVEEITFVRDFTVTREQPGDRLVARPVVDTTWDGVKSDFVATFLPNGSIGLACTVHLRQVERPIPEAKVQVVKDRLQGTIQMPRATGVKLTSVAELPVGSALVLAATRSSGDYLVATVRAQAEKPGRR
jgi:hypothetical protein